MAIEASVSIYLCGLLSLTDFTGETTPRIQLGWVLAMLTGIVIAINFVLFLWKILCRAVIHIKKILPCYTVKKKKTVSIKPNVNDNSPQKRDKPTFIVNH